MNRDIEERKIVLRKISEILIGNVGVARKVDEIDPDTPLFGSGLGLDSVDAMELVVCVQSTFQAQIPPDGSGRKVMRTLNTLADFIMESQGEGK